MEPTAPSSAGGGTRILERPGQGAVLVVTPARLAVTDGVDRGKDLTIEGRSVVIGSAADCDLVLTDTAVSARHFSITADATGFLLRDLQSTNGTTVGGFRALALYLPRSASIEVGGARLDFTVGGDEVEVPISGRTRFGELLGHSGAMRQVFAILERVAPSDTTVLLEGESGTGKELAARALHDASSRREGLFVAVDCGTLPAGLIESELFGHEKGSFTGATAARAGLFEEASGGTLFFDEVGELPLDLQPKLLRALETRTVRRVGESRSRPVDVRLVAATNRNLAEEVTAGRFRRDLFFRLSVIRLRLPPLRERPEEIPRLVAHFMAQLGRDPSQRLPESVISMLASYGWPGNVRELRNVVERLVLLPGMGPEFYLGQSSAAPGPDASTAVLEPPFELPFHEGKRVWMERFERAYLARQLVACKGNISEVARVTGLSRQSCHRLLARYGLES
jgi:DNA-binding NtrC family response regulator